RQPAVSRNDIPLRRINHAIAVGAHHVQYAAVDDDAAAVAQPGRAHPSSVGADKIPTDCAYASAGDVDPDAAKAINHQTSDDGTTADLQPIDTDSRTYTADLDLQNGIVARAQRVRQRAWLGVPIDCGRLSD